MNFSVQSEVGQLKQVIVHRPGLELSRLTPRNVGELLFDDVLWAGRAREEHDAFAEALRDRGVRVHYFGQLLAETLAVPAGRTFVLDRLCVPEMLGPELTGPVRRLFDDLDGPELAEFLVGGVLKADLNPARPHGPDLGRAARGRLRAAAAAQPPVPAGQLLLDLPRGLGQPDGQARPPARVAAQPGHLPVPPDVRRGRLHLALRRHGRQAHARHRGGRRRARARPRGGDDRDGRADHADGGRAAGPGAVPRRAGQRGDRGRAAVLPRHDAPGHGDDHGGPRDVRAVPLPGSAAAVVDRHPRWCRR